MSPHEPSSNRPVTIDDVDVTGAVRDAAEAAGVDRRVFLGRAGAATAGAAGAVLGLPSLADAAISARPSRANDVRILNFALVLEHLDGAFYTAAIAANDLPNPAYLRFAQVVRAHELEHARVLTSALGSAAIAAPAFEFGDAVGAAKFPAAAQVLEDTGVEALAGQGARILRRGVLRTALALQAVEARHASWIRSLNIAATRYGFDAADERALPAPQALDSVTKERTVLRRVAATGFLRSALPTGRV